LIDIVSRVIGLTFDVLSQLVMADRSYVWPSLATTGSRKSVCSIGHIRSFGTVKPSVGDGLRERGGALGNDNTESEIARGRCPAVVLFAVEFGRLLLLAGFCEHTS
jgi:hypothetical protein